MKPSAPHLHASILGAVLLMIFAVAPAADARFQTDASSLATGMTAPPSGQIRIPVATRADLPAFSYPVPGTAQALLQSDDVTFAAFAARVDADIAGVLAAYEIRDAATLRALLGTRADIAMLAGRDTEALALFARIRELEDKPDRRPTARLDDEALLRARASPGAEALPVAFARAYAALLAPLPWDVVGNRILQARVGMVFNTEALTLGTIAASVEPGLARTGEVGAETASSLVASRVALRNRLPVKHVAMRVMADYIATHRVDPPDVWAARDVDLSGRDGLHPVNVAIWDEGVDLALFPGRVFTDPDPSHDPHGIAFDLDFHPAQGPLIPLDAAQQAIYPERLRLVEGSVDMSLGLDSPAARYFVETVDGLVAEDVPGLQEEMAFLASFYTHGTHVAGIAAEGNPAIRLAYGRQNWDWRNVPAAPTDENVARMSRNFQTFVDWFSSRGMRVVNMSWAGSPLFVESALEANGLGEDAADRRAIARRMFDSARDALHAAIAGAPDILFIAAGGNSNSDASFDEFMPSSFDLPNLITVGAVDLSGNEAGFTSYGPTVRVHANGQQVEAVVPGGQRLRFSGTSMAAPQVANLAAKLLAIDPSLQPGEVIALIVEGTTPSADGRRHNIDPKRSIVLLDARRAPPR